MVFRSFTSLTGSVLQDRYLCLNSLFVTLVVDNVVTLVVVTLVGDKIVTVVVDSQNSKS